MLLTHLASKHKVLITLEKVIFIQIYLTALSLNVYTHIVQALKLFCLGQKLKGTVKVFVFQHKGFLN